MKPRRVSHNWTSLIWMKKFFQTSTNVSAENLSPKRFFTWAEAIVMAPAEVKADTTGVETRSTRKPNEDKIYSFVIVVIFKSAFKLWVVSVKKMSRSTSCPLNKSYLCPICSYFLYRLCLYPPLSLSCPLHVLYIFLPLFTRLNKCGNLPKCKIPHNSSNTPAKNVSIIAALTLPNVTWCVYWNVSNDMRAVGAMLSSGMVPNIA